MIGKIPLISITFIGLLLLMPIISSSGQNLEELPIYESTIMITHDDPIKDTSVFIFQIQYNGLLIVSYDWPIDIGAPCSSALVNFWDTATLTDKQQTDYGNLGFLRIIRCQENTGSINITIDETTTKKYSLPLNLYLEVDTDISFTSIIQDPLELVFEFYPYEGQTAITENSSVKILATLLILTMTYVMGVSIRRLKKKEA
ncbi:MAG: hypothetical protein FK734_02980 [Asgard group archaeon]|nr:hypothetical protein [Asgard group archaeon]